jgi:AcrR family transcriptional regulator
MEKRIDKKSLRRDKILRSAQQLFLAQGVEATSVEDIAAAAGVSRATLFNYFRGKNAILELMSAQMEPRLVQLVQHYLGKPLPTADRLQQIFSHSAKVIEQTGDLNRLLFVHGSAGRGFPSLYQAFSELMSAAGNRGDVQEGEDIQLAAELVYLSFVAGILGWLREPVEDLQRQFESRARYLCDKLLA